MAQYFAFEFKIKEGDASKTCFSIGYLLQVW